ncbi:MAG TPA: MATE family efflux transporter [Bacilli bacterium]|nr:MATE family efflux transporter [Bacilli bacterium]
MPNKNNLKDIFSISIPTTISRLLGNIGYFFEPIIITNILLYLGYSNNYITYNYGIINGYVLSLLMLPSFFTMAISQAIIPVISKSYSNNDIKNTKKKIKQGIFFSLLIGIPISIVFLVIPDVLLKLIYNTTEGINYIRILSLFFLLQYISIPLSSSLQAMGKANIVMKGTLINIILKSLVLIIGLLLIGIWGLILSLIFGIVFSTLYSYYYIKKEIV